MMIFVSGNDDLRKLAGNGQPPEDQAENPPDGGDAHTRREAGARHETSEPLVFYQGDRQIEGWALNISHGGLRAVIDERLAVGEELELVIGDNDVRRSVRVVWARAEKGGAIVGLAFLDGTPGSVPPPPDDDEPAGQQT